MASKFPEAETRLLKNVYVCRKCKSKIRTTYAKVKARLAKCRSCGSKQLRPKNKVKSK
ncbi:50S ribosomal protein L40e [archaeon CG10_big_fil_rev_8_21_14_0_10_43_11]|nr:MAG: 50S ribosomal protein L40e [archaeon CG10_big_fil_rev_8_21_14_0_10_43_11]